MDHVERKERTRDLWAQGDWASIAGDLDGAALAVVQACGVRPGSAVLDVAAGTGNVAVRAARAGADVVAIDLCPALVDQGRRRCQAEGLAVDWREADMEHLPFADGCFDSVLCAFGISFAPRPEVALAEILRVTRAGGRVGLVHWAPDSWAARTAAIMARHLGGHPPPTSAWTSRDHSDAGAWLAERTGSARVERGTVWHQFASAEEWWAQWHHGAPHLAMARRALSDDAYRGLRDDLIASVRDADAGDGTVTRWACDYLVVVATKSGGEGERVGVGSEGGSTWMATSGS